MRVLLDECVPIQLKREFAEFDARTVRDMGWRTIKNGALLLRAAEEFDAVVTVDVGLDTIRNQDDDRRVFSWVVT
jgi:predicted nuclease of predicted toxin-antitoxin system